MNKNIALTFPDDEEQPSDGALSEKPRSKDYSFDTISQDGKLPPQGPMALGSSFGDTRIAKYDKSEDPRFLGHPLVESWLPVLPNKEIMKRLTYLPARPTDETRKLPIELRREMVSTTFEVYVANTRTHFKTP